MARFLSIKKEPFESAADESLLPWLAADCDCRRLFGEDDLFRKMEEIRPSPGRPVRWPAIKEMLVGSNVDRGRLLRIDRSEDVFR